MKIRECVDLSPELKRYSLPLKVENEEQAILASLSFLDIGKKEITYPLFALLYAMASFIFWVQNNFGALQKLFSDRFPELMNQFNAEGHGAYSEQNAFLTFSLETVFSWTADKGLTTGSETARMAVEAGSILHGEAQNR